MIVLEIMEKYAWPMHLHRNLFLPESRGFGQDQSNNEHQANNSQ